jgi:hypothetical protein
VELGIPAAAALLLAIAAAAAICVRGVRRRNRDTIFPRVGVAAAALAGTHAAVDFTFEIPAVAAAFCLLMGCAVAQSWRGREWQTDPVDSSARPAARPQIATQQV